MKKYSLYEKYNHESRWRRVSCLDGCLREMKVVCKTTLERTAGNDGNNDPITVLRPVPRKRKK